MRGCAAGAAAGRALVTAAGPGLGSELLFVEIRGSAPILLDDVALKSHSAMDSVQTDPLGPTP